MQVKVRMCAFCEGDIRLVEIPEGTVPTPDSIFQYGQNDFQPHPTLPSVSVGDVIEWDGKLVCVSPVGFKEVTEEWYERYMKHTIVERVKLTYYFNGSW